MVDFGLFFHGGNNFTDGANNLIRRFLRYFVTATLHNHLAASRREPGQLRLQLVNPNLIERREFPIHLRISLLNWIPSGEHDERTISETSRRSRLFCALLPSM